MITAALLHSVSYAGLWGQASLSVEDFVDKAAALGYDGVLLMAKRPHVSVLDYGPKERARLRARIEKAGLRSVAIAGYTNFTADLEHGDIPTREMQVRHVVELAELARDLGGDKVRVFTGYENPAAPYAAQMKIVVDSLRECARRAAEFGVTIGVQNHHDLACGFEAMRDLIQAVCEPNCRAMFDAWAPALHGADILAAARALGSLTVHTTIADYQLRPRYAYEPAIVNYRALNPAVQAVRMGEGFIDYRGFLAALSEGGFRGSVAYEMCSPLREGGSIETLDSYARTFLEFLKA
ncbi:MAG: sugar phosphate isomerase/epimerase family protein [Acidobacteriota bacterium]